MPKFSQERFSRRNFLTITAALGAEALLGFRGLPDPEKLASKEKTLPPVVYLLAKETGVAVYAHPTEDSFFTPRHEILAGAIISGEILPDNAEFVRVHPDNGFYLPFTKEDGKLEVFVRRADFQELTNFTPLSVNSDTQNPDKQIVVLFNGYYPEGMLLEKDKIVAYFPVGLGGNYQSSSTYPAEYHINSLRVTRNMNTLHGVPFVAYYNRAEGKAFHGAPWKPWSEITRGYFGSAGCINLASYNPQSPYNINWDGETMGFDHFVFRWLRTVFPFNVYQEEMMEVEWTPRDWYSGEQTVRTIVCRTIDGLDSYATHPQGLAAFQNWEKVKADYLKLREDSQWLLPTRNNGATSYVRAYRHGND